MENVSIIIPTYNEKDNIARLIPDIEEVLAANDIEGEVIVIDDNSPDETGKFAEHLNERYGNIVVVHRESKQGVGSARRTGFAKAKNAIIISMEGDNTHNPEYLPQFIKEIKAGASLVIGSRYMQGSEILNWPMKRKVISKLANWVARIFAGIKLTDVTNGYRAFTKELSDKLVVDSQSYPYNMEFACETVWRGYVVKEIPIRFVHRTIGISKMNARKEFFAFFLTVFRFSYTYRPMVVFGRLGAFFFSAGIIIAGYLTYLKLSLGIIGDRLPLIIFSLVLILGGIQIFSFGLIVNVLNKLRREILKSSDV